jgi:AAA15 family ATPase/GTPase
MEDNHLKSFEVSGFKKFDNLKLEDLGQFNLIIGDNNVGKTSLLEALLVNQDYNKFIDSLGSINFSIRKFNNLSEPFINLYFSNNQNASLKQFHFHLGYNTEPLEFFGLKANNDSTFLIDGNGKGLIGSIVLSIRNNEHEGKAYNINVPYIPMGAFYQHELTTQYSNNIQLFVDKKERLLNALSYLIPEIKNIEVNAGLANVPVLLLAENKKNTLSPLATYGDGAQKLFRIAMSLFTNNHYSRLMIDEIDAGIHHSHLKYFIKSLIEVANEEKKQIFATTHSKECIENFTKALEETGMQDEGRIIRLAETKNGIKAFTMRFAEFENSIMAESEIR